MRPNSKKKAALLLTDDPAVETTVRNVARKMGHQFRYLKSNQDAMCIVSDVSASEAVVIVDLDGGPGRRSLLNTAGGMLPVIAVSKEEKPWLKSMLRRKRVGASLAKPLQVAALTAALNSIDVLGGAFSDPAPRCDSTISLEEVFEADFRNISEK